MSLRKERNLRDMRKRRVGVTAGARLVVGHQVTGTPQTATEIAAPLVSRTPMCTVAAATTECGWKRGDTTGVKTIGQKTDPVKWSEIPEGRRAHARMRRCLILRQGDRPPETPGPLSLGLDCTEGRKSVKGSLRRQHRPPLTDFLPSEETHPGYEGKGAKGTGALHASRWSAPGEHKIRRRIT